MITRPLLVALSLVLLAPLGVAHAEEYVVGSGSHPNLGSVPWDELGPGDIVTIPYRAEPYRETFAISTSGTAEAPILVRGTPSGSGQRPIIDGENAVRGAGTHVRSLISLREGASHVIVEGLELRNAHVRHTHDGLFPSNNASGIYIEDASHVTVRNCEIHDNGNGLFSAPGTSDVHVERNYIWGNGNENSIYEHNSYTESDGIVFEGNRYGPLCNDCPGTNLKDRSAACVIRYNFLEGGNRVFDLVDAETGDDAFNARVRSTPTFVYGNVMIKIDDTTQSQVVHFGGDTGDTGNYRQRLYFFNNTVFSTRVMRTTLFFFDADSPIVDVRNSIFVASSAQVFVMDSSTSEGSEVTLTNDLMPVGWEVSVETSLESTVTSTGLVESDSPGFVNEGARDFHLTASSVARNAGAALHANEPVVAREYVAHQATGPRSVDGPLDIGAFEFCESGCTPAAEPDGGIFADGGGGGGGGGGGCGCTVPAAGHDRSGHALMLALLGLLAVRRRRRLPRND